MESSENISMLIAFSAGILSFFSPCVLPLVPSYLMYISGMTYDDMTAQTSGKEWWNKQKSTLFHSIFFILGLSMVFISLGASATFLGRFVGENQVLLQKAGGIVIILFGLFITGIIRLDFLQKEKRIHFKNRPIGYLGSSLIGVAFAAGWTPCVGPVLGSILLYATTANKISSGMWLLGIYSMGLGIPFIICSMSMNRFLSSFNRIKRYMRIISLVSGIFLIIVGLLIFTNNFNMIANYIDSLRY
ncbi:MAG: cytochrome c biogenesis CcdA family protein [Nitrospirota bacterium]